MIPFRSALRRGFRPLRALFRLCREVALPHPHLPESRVLRLLHRRFPRPVGREYLYSQRNLGFDGCKQLWFYSLSLFSPKCVTTRIWCDLVCLSLQLSLRVTLTLALYWKNDPFWRGRGGPPLPPLWRGGISFCAIPAETLVICDKRGVAPASVTSRGRAIPTWMTPRRTGITIAVGCARLWALAPWLRPSCPLSILLFLLVWAQYYPWFFVHVPGATFIRP